MLLVFSALALAAETTDEVGGATSTVNMASGWAAQFYTATRTTRITELALKASETGSGSASATLYLWEWDPATFSYDSTSLGTVVIDGSALAWYSVRPSSPVSVRSGTTYAVGFGDTTALAAFATSGASADVAWGTGLGFATGLMRDGGPTDITTLRSGAGVNLRITSEVPDRDGDGFGETDDCDESDPSVYPGAPEIWYDGIDQACDGDSDDDDADGDGHDADFMRGDDCDDTRADVHPGARDVWYDGEDSDCGGNDDYDQDGDGSRALEAGGTDCDDTDATVRPGAADAAYDGIDTDCSGSDDYDADRDGHRPYAWGGDDCDDADPRRWEDCSGDDTGAPDTGGSDSGTDEDSGPIETTGSSRTRSQEASGCHTGPASVPGGTPWLLALVAVAFGRRRAAR